jgi:hypothetical protein
MCVKARKASCLAFLLVNIFVSAQQSASSPQASPPLTIAGAELPPASLWVRYNFQLQAGAGIGPYHWHLIGGTLPQGMKFDDHGELIGIPEEVRQSEFAVQVTDSDNPAKQLQKKFTLKMEIPLSADWGRKAQVNSQRIDGSVKVSNRTGRDFDLTLIVLAVNEIGRATAIGYQHFTLKPNTRDFDIPFGQTLSRGDYTVNVDVVGEEPVSNRIFRARLVSGKETVVDGP